MQAPSQLISDAANLPEFPPLNKQRYDALLAKRKELWETENHLKSVQGHLGMEYAEYMYPKIAQLEKEARQLEYDAANETFYERLTACRKKMGLENVDDTHSNLDPQPLKDIKIEIWRGMRDEGWVTPGWEPDPKWKPQSAPSQ